MRVGYITGADLMMPRDIFNQIGGFSPDFFMYYKKRNYAIVLNVKVLKSILFLKHEFNIWKEVALKMNKWLEDMVWRAWTVTYYKLTSTFFGIIFVLYHIVISYTLLFFFKQKKDVCSYKTH